MLSDRLNLLLARDRARDLLVAAGRGRQIPAGQTPVTRVTLRWAADADRDGLRRLAELGSGVPPVGAALVAEVDGRLRAALPLDGSGPIADPFHRGNDLVELLRVRAAQLTRG